MRSDSSRQSTFQELRTLPENTLVKLRITRARDCEGALRSSTSVATSSSIIQRQRSNRRDQLSCTFPTQFTCDKQKQFLGEPASTASSPKKHPDSTRRIGPGACHTNLLQCSISWHRHFPRICERTAVHRQFSHPATRYPRPAMLDLAELDRQPSLSFPPHFCTWMEYAWFI